MSTIPGSVDTSMSTFVNTLPPVTPYLDQHRTCIIVNFPKSIWSTEANYGLVYGKAGDSGEGVIDFGFMSTVTLATLIASVQAAMELVLDSIQNDTSITSDWDMGNAYYAYEIQELTGFYYVTKIALYDVSCIAWLSTIGSIAAGFPGVRFWMVKPVINVLNPNEGYGFSHTIQWGFEPHCLTLIA